MQPPALPPQLPTQAQYVPPNQDDAHIKTLVIFHYISAGLALLGMLFLILHYVMLSTIFMNEAMWKEAEGSPPPKEFFEIFRWFYAVMAVFIITSGVLNFLSATYMRKHRNRTFCIVVAGLNCLSFPMGTALGVFTIVVLMRPSVCFKYKELET